MTMLQEIQATAAAGHVCTAACVAAYQVECECAGACRPLCSDCEAFFAAHPGAL